MDEVDELAVQLRLVGVLQRVAHRDRHLQRDRRREPARLREQAIQGRPPDQLHGDEEVAVHLPEVVRLDDRGVVQQPPEPSLAHQGLAAGLVARAQRAPHDLDRGRLAEALQSVDLCLEDARHAPLTEQAEQRVPTELDRELPRSELVGGGHFEATGRRASWLVVPSAS